MNDLLELKGTLNYANINVKIDPSFKKNQKVTTSDLEKLIRDLEKQQEYWKDKNIIPGVLISVYYNRTIPKSSRIKFLFSRGSEESNIYVKGVRFKSPTEKKHIITYYLEKDMLNICIDRLKKLQKILDTLFDGEIDNDKLHSITGEEAIIKECEFSKTKTKTFFIDAVDIEKIDLFTSDDNPNTSNSFITIFNTDIAIGNVLNNLGINKTDFNVFSPDTIYTSNPSVLLKIQKEAPYLISMALTDLAKYNLENENRIPSTIDFINTPSPTTEPTIGVIDTLFDENVYFSEWVEAKDLVNSDYERKSEDYVHGTKVSSIIVDGARMNPKWDDGCGMFRVRHFGVAINGTNSTYDILTKIKEIVIDNPDIHVWNLSLGSALEINDNYISPEAAMLDELQYNYPVVFVVAGTNKENDNVEKIGAPADSINSLVVNAVDKNFNAASYSRKGGVLSFFVKPDVCYFGGDSNELINTCDPCGISYCRGTSFAAPWISRKMSFLIDKMGLSREIAKALIINSAFGWETDNAEKDYKGYGVVPTKISDVLMGRNEEIKFFIEGIAKSYYTYNYNIPVPLVEQDFPFKAKAVMCYFPKCNRSQGVDYTNTELDLQFGRMSSKGIKSLNKNTQGEAYNAATDEYGARALFRKWDNVKIVIDSNPYSKRSVKSYGGNNWGLNVTNKERIERDRGLKFGVVVTLKEVNDKNRIKEFEMLCASNNWIVNRVNLENRIDVYNKAEEIVKFE